MTMDDEREVCPCETCGLEGGCDVWEALYCCTLCKWNYGDIEPPCEDCDPWDI